MSPCATLLYTLAGLLACAGDKPIDDPGDGGGAGDGGAAEGCGGDAECSPWEICEAAACVDGDRNNAVDEAQGVLWDDTAQGYVNPAGDVDYYALSAVGGEFVRIRTIHEYGEGDTVVTLRDPTGKVVTTSDNYPTGATLSSADSTIYAWLGSAGQYIIEVEDQGTYYGGAATGAPDYLYTLSIETWDLHTDETDGLADPSLEIAIDAFNSYAAIGVVLEEPGDVDYLRLSHGLTDGALWVYSMLDLSGSEADPRVQVYSAGGELLLDRDDAEEGTYGYHPAFAAGDYTVAFSDSDGGGSGQHWFFLFLMLRDNGGAYPVEQEPNDLQAQADTISMTETKTDSGNTYAYGQVTGFVDAEGDEDWFEVPARPDAELAVCISSSPGGSLVAPDLELYSADGALLGTAPGSASTYPTARLDDLFLGEDPAYIRVVDPDPAATGGGAWYRMVVYTADFDITDYEEGGYSCPS